MDEIVIALPFPPTVNHYWKFVRNRTNIGVYISEKGMLYRDEVLFLTINHKNENKWELARSYFGGERIAVSIAVYPPDKRRRDLDNILKCVLDSMAKAKIYEDDYQIDNLYVERKEVCKDGKLIVTVRANKEPGIQRHQY